LTFLCPQPSRDLHGLSCLRSLFIRRPQGGDERRPCVKQ
jgi:hypothetical protein